MHLVGFIIRIRHDARSFERQKRNVIFEFLPEVCIYIMVFLIVLSMDGPIKVLKEHTASIFRTEMSRIKMWDSI